MDDARTILSNILNPTPSKGLVNRVNTSLRNILPSPGPQDFYRTLRILRFLARNQELRRRFIGHDNVIEALVLALEWTVKSFREHSFLLVVASLRYLVHDSKYDHRYLKFILILFR